MFQLYSPRAMISPLSDCCAKRLPVVGRGVDVVVDRVRAELAVVEAVEPDHLEPPRPERDIDIPADLVGIAAGAVVDIAKQVDRVDQVAVLLERRVGVGPAVVGVEMGHHRARAVPLETAGEARKVADELDQDVRIGGGHVPRAIVDRRAAVAAPRLRARR
jgi:hypothetical protein